MGRRIRDGLYLCLGKFQVMIVLSKAVYDSMKRKEIERKTSIHLFHKNHYKQEETMNHMILGSPYNYGAHHPSPC